MDKTKGLSSHAQGGGVDDAYDSGDEEDIRCDQPYPHLPRAREFLVAVPVTLLVFPLLSDTSGDHDETAHGKTQHHFERGAPDLHERL